MRLLLSVVLVFSAIQVLGKNRKDIPLAPFPASIVNAKTVFIVPVGGANLAYDAFYSDMAAWGRYEIVKSSEEADLIIELNYLERHNGIDISSVTNYQTGNTQTTSTEILDPQVQITIYASKSKNPLWSATDHRRLAKQEKNRNKEIIKSAERLVDQLKTRIAVR